MISHRVLKCHLLSLFDGGYRQNVFLFVKPVSKRTQDLLVLVGDLVSLGPLLGRAQRPKLQWKNQSIEGLCTQKLPQ